MSSKKKKRTSGQGMNLMITLVTLSLIFVFVGYLLGQYAVKLLQQQHRTSMELAREGASVQPVITSTVHPAPQTNVSKEAAPVSPPVVIPESIQTPSTALYRVQVGVFSEKANADRMETMLADAGYEALVVSGPPYRVQTGAFSSEGNAAKLRDELLAKGFEAIIVR